jgi:outer membrane protein OmpA-like peptidoglycan-associated protein
LDVYHDELNILGKRMRMEPTISITLTGSNANTGTELNATELSQKRAEAVKEYLSSTWGIDPKRITVTAQNLPRNPSSVDTREGAEENRRVEITSKDPSVLDPLTVTTIDRTMNPPKIRVYNERHSRYSLTHDELTLTEGDKTLATFPSPYPVQDWVPSPTELPTTTTGLVATLHLRDSLGTEFTKSDTARIEQLTIRRKREERVQDKIIEHYNLITFDFDKADLDTRSQRAIKEIAKSVTPNDKIVIRGYTDMTGERAHNLELSDARAKAVETALRNALGERATSVRFDVAGLGQTNLVDNGVPEGRFLSRTVFVELQKPVQ